MVARLEKDAKRRAEKKHAPVRETALPGSVQEIDEVIKRAIGEVNFARDLELVGSLLPHLPPPAEALVDALWDAAVESLGRSAGVLEELAESTGEAIARISARGDRIDRIQKETRALLNALVASEADA